MKPTEEQKKQFRAKHHKVLTELNRVADELVQEMQDRDSMIESRTDRQIFAEMNEMRVVDAKHIADQPRVTDFTTVLPSPTQDGQFSLRVKLDSRWVTIGIHSSREDAELAEVALNQAMIEYRTKRDAWEKRLTMLPRAEKL